MKLNFTSILLTLLLPVFALSQDLTGIWRGYFIQKEFNPFVGRFVEEKYKFEVQIKQNADNTIEGVTYSYKTTVFYGKASLHGRFSKSQKTAILKEIKLIEEKNLMPSSFSCLMTCFVDYTKRGKLELLTGNYTSINSTNSDKPGCGDGMVYLEKVENSDFELEPFLSKKKTDKGKPKDENTKSVASKDNPQTTKPHNPSRYFENQKIPNEPNKNAGVAKKPNKPIKPGAEHFVVEKQKEDTTCSNQVIDTVSTTSISDTLPKNSHVENQTPEPLVQRENPTVATIFVEDKNVKIEYFDNGEIDNDSISVYDNNKQVVNSGRLSYKPIVVLVKFEQPEEVHEVITVAENLGDIPPNTALMVITSGRQRTEVFLTTDAKKNAKVILKYIPKK